MKKLTLFLALLFITTLTGCSNSQDVVHQKSVMVLNQRAQTLLNAGDMQGAIGRLEAAHDLLPNEPRTVNNLAVAYSQSGQFDKAVALYTELLEKPPAPGDKEGLKPQQIQIGLGTAYEGWADELMNKSDDAAEKPDKKAQSAQYKEQAIATYEKAIESYKLVNPAPAEITTQIQAVEERVNALRKK